MHCWAKRVPYLDTLCPPAPPLVPRLQPPESPLKEQQAAVLEALGLGLEHSLQDGPLSKQVCGCRVLVGAAVRHTSRLSHLQPG